MRVCARHSLFDPRQKAPHTCLQTDQLSIGATVINASAYGLKWLLCGHQSASLHAARTMLNTQKDDNPNACSRLLGTQINREFAHNFSSVCSAAVARKSSLSRSRERLCNFTFRAKLNSSPHFLLYHFGASDCVCLQ